MFLNQKDEIKTVLKGILIFMVYFDTKLLLLNFSSKIIFQNKIGRWQSIRQNSRGMHVSIGYRQKRKSYQERIY